MFTVLRSSAGAGKTHALVKNYLRLCLATDNATAYRHVLALTFTNKAASEMKERVVRYMEQLAAGDHASAPIQDVLSDLQRTAHLDQASTSDRAKKVLHHMLHHWDEVAISTIDAFTRRVVRPFSRDLQLDQDLRMTTEHEWYRESAVKAVIAEAGINAPLTELLTAACEQLLDDEARWDPALPLSELGKELDKESSIAPLAALHGMDAETVMALTEGLRKETGAYERAAQSLGKRIVEGIQAAGITPEELAGGKNGYHSFFRKLAAFGDEWLEPSATARKAFDNDKLGSGKIKGAAVAALEELGPHLHAWFAEANELLALGQRDHFVRAAVLRELPSAFALIELDRSLRMLKEADGVAFFSDLTRLVAQVVRDEPAPFIFERLGERYRHFLLDEFQDTSLLQWHTLLPLIHNALSSGGSALLVGDAKQAIYRWRNGEVRLFTTLPGLFPPARTPVEREYEQALRSNDHPIEPLAINHRSASTIIEFNNGVFGALAATLPESLRPVYTAHEQIVRRSEPGRVRMERPSDSEPTEERAATMDEFVLRSVRDAEDDGFAPGDIAVLVRTAAIGQTISRVLTEAGYSVTSPDGLRLEGDDLAECLIDLLRVVHTSDPAAATRVVQYRVRIRASASDEQVDPFGTATKGFDPVAVVRTLLADHGSLTLRTTINELIGRLAQAIDASPDPHLLTLMDEAHAFGIAHGQDIGAFLEHWDRSGKRRNTAAPVNAQSIQVMTVHKAKGLEFPVVIIPSTRMAAGGTQRERLWIQPGTAVPELEHALVAKSAILRDAALPEIREEDDLRKLDELDLLYVAFTRAVQQLHVFLPNSKPDELTKGLQKYMEDHGHPDVLDTGERTGPWTARTADPTGSITIAMGTPPGLAIRFEATEHWDPADPDPYRRYGNAVHAILSRVDHPEDLERAISTTILEGLIPETDAMVLRDRLDPLLRSEELIPWFGSGVKVRTESAIIDASGRTHRPDRVVFDGDTVRVLDIKTGASDERHQDQVRRYMRLLGDLGYAHVEGALLYITDGTLIPVAA
ncbi:MAG: UvrD-helicase domain-containing protein [Flavobacteriales bacterium]|nr:UvrD-helicase domain-containing protein [Flavobacteriales bacterium]